MINNKVTLIGEIETDPELQISPSNRPFATITIATMLPYKNSEGEYERDFNDVQLLAELAEEICNHASKGSVISVEGRLTNLIIELADNQNFKTSIVIAERVSLITNGNGRDVN